jgi:ABC-type glycerol-3-phosphate transport system substrate-binding protein
MKRLISLLLAFALCFMAFSGTSPGPTAVKKVQLKLGIWPAESYEADVKSAQDAKAKFEAKYPNIEVVPASYAYQPTTFMPMAASGTLPTVFTTWFTEPQKLIENGFVADITDIVKKKGLDKAMNPAVLKLLSKDGKIYGIPRDGYALGLYINMNIFKEAGLVDAKGLPLYPKTFDELAATAKVIKDKTGKAGMFIASANNVGGWHFTQIGWAFGASFEKQLPSGEWVANIDTPEVLAALQFVYDLKWKYDVLLPDALMGWAEWIKNYGTDKVGMVLAAPDVISAPVADYNMNKDAIAIVPVPKGPGGQFSLMGGTPFMFAANATPEEIDAAIKWLEFTGWLPIVNTETMAQREVGIANKAERGEPIGPQPLPVWVDPTYKKAIDDLYAKHANVNMDLFKDYYAIAPFNVHPEEPVKCQDLYAVLDTVLQVVLTQKDADLKALLADANKQVTEILKN